LRYPPPSFLPPSSSFSPPGSTYWNYKHLIRIFNGVEVQTFTYNPEEDRKTM
jgi:hypothetical protein